VSLNRVFVFSVIVLQLLTQSVGLRPSVIHGVLFACDTAKPLFQVANLCELRFSVQLFCDIDHSAFLDRLSVESVVAYVVLVLTEESSGAAGVVDVGTGWLALLADNGTDGR
jgi:hypothetical protein